MRDERLVKKYFAKPKYRGSLQIILLDSASNETAVDHQTSSRRIENERPGKRFITFLT